MDYKDLVSSSIFFLWFVLLPIINCNILRLPCKMIAEFSIKKGGQKLENSIIETRNNVKLQQCFDSCMHNYRCKSVNFKTTSTGICQISNRSSVDIFDAVSLTVDPDWDFYSSDFSDKLVGQRCKSSNPCKDDEICFDTCECPGYECIKCIGNTRGANYCNKRCMSNPCGANGNCNEVGQMCTCKSGYEGSFCETMKNPCDPNPCQNRGGCVSYGGIFSRCNCDGARGTYCETIG